MIQVTYIVIKIGDVTKIPARKYLLNLANKPIFSSDNFNSWWYKYYRLYE